MRIKQRTVSGGGLKIDFRSVGAVTGYLLLIEAAVLLLPLIVCLIYKESDWQSFIPAILMSVLAGGVLSLMCGEGHKVKVNRREGYFLTAIIWIVFSGLGMIPFMLCNHPLTMVDAYFETMSGFTTTGATVIEDVEKMSHGILFWRSLMQWLGGLGIVIFMLAVLPQFNQSGGVPMFNAEATGITHDKLHPRIRQTAKSLWQVYVVLTLVLLGFLWVGPMNFFDALCHAMTTMSTGGFSTKNASLVSWHSDYVATVVSIFMLIGGVNFMLLYGLVKGNARQLLKNDVFRVYSGVVITYFLVILGVVYFGHHTDSLTKTLVYPLFQVATTITTTGFSYGEFESWGNLVFFLVVSLMIVGSCAGSTTGAVKIDRMLALWKNLRKETELTLYPRHVKTVELNGKAISTEQLSKISAFFTIYILLLVIGSVAMSAYGYSPQDSFFATASCIGNNGQGYGVTGIYGSGFGLLPEPLKWLFASLMLVGRLEVFTILVVFTRQFWRR